MKNSLVPDWFGRMFARSPQTPEQLLATAEREGPDSQNNLGIIYMAAPERGESDHAAAECFLAAAKRGHGPAQYNLGLLYERGQGVPQSANEAHAWFLRAAEQGNPSAHFRLGVQSHRKSLDLKDEAADESKTEALKWLLLAAEQGYHKAEGLCGSLALEMTQAQVNDSNRRAATFKSFFA